MAKDRDEFVAVLARELTSYSSSEISDLARKLMRFGRMYARF
jgi:hypothetical protein